MTYQSASFDEKSISRALPVPASVTASAGAMVRRPDLTDAEVLAAIAERLAFEGRDPAHAPGVLKAAREGRHVAKAFMRKLVLPAPRSPLAMPIQAILREKAERSGSSGWSRLVPFGR